VSVAAAGEVDDDLVRDMTVSVLRRHTPLRQSVHGGPSGIPLRARPVCNDAFGPWLSRRGLSFRLQLGSRPRKGPPARSTGALRAGHAPRSWSRRGSGVGGRDHGAGPLDPLLTAPGVEPCKGRDRSLVGRELQGGLQLGLGRPGPGTEWVFRFKRWCPGRCARVVPACRGAGPTKPAPPRDLRRCEPPRRCRPRGRTSSPRAL